MIFYKYKLNGHDFYLFQSSVHLCLLVACGLVVWMYFCLISLVLFGTARILMELEATTQKSE